MIIGFTQRTRTISEGEEDHAIELFQLQVNLTTLRTSERVHPMTIRVQWSSSTAIVEPLLVQTDPDFDAVFGSRDLPGRPIREAVVWAPGASTIPPLLVAIRNDFIPEEEECFTIRIFPDDHPHGYRDFFMCNGDSAGADSYFCQHTICITDDDGELSL